MAIGVYSNTGTFPAAKITGRRPHVLKLAKDMLDELPDRTYLDVSFSNHTGRTVLLEVYGMGSRLITVHGKVYPKLHGRGASKQRKRRM